MKVKIRETYVQCDICKQKISRHIFHNSIYRISVKNVEKKGSKNWYKIDMCRDCYDKISTQVRKELKEEAKKNENI